MYNYYYKTSYQSILTESIIPNSIDGLKRFYDTLDYGTVLDGKKYTGKIFTPQVIDKAHILFPQEIRKYRVGTCYDTAGYSFKYLTEWGVKFKCYFVNTRKEYDKVKGIWDDPTHTFIIYYDINEDHKWHWLEGSWWLHKDNTLVEDDPGILVNKIRKLWNKEKAYCREIKKYPKCGISYHNFYKQLMLICRLV